MTKAARRSLRERALQAHLNRLGVTKAEYIAAYQRRQLRPETTEIRTKAHYGHRTVGNERTR